MKYYRSKRGHNTIELATVLFAFVIVTLLAVDIAVLCLANSSNDSACRDAARAAAAAQDYAASLRMARAAIAAHAVNSPFVDAPQLDAATFTYEDFGGSPPPNISPYVQVTTFMTVKVPAPVNFAGARFYPNDGTTQVRKTYEFPIVKTQLYL